MPKIYVIFCLLLHISLQAMEKSDLSLVNQQICEYLAQIEQATPSLSEEERANIDEMIKNIGYSNFSMGEEESKRFINNYKSIIQGNDEDRKNYLNHVSIFLDDNDVMHLELQETFFENLKNIVSYAGDFDKKLWSNATFGAFIVFYYDMLQKAWEKEEPGYGIMAKMAFLLPAIFYKQPPSKSVMHMLFVSMGIGVIYYDYFNNLTAGANSK